MRRIAIVLMLVVACSAVERDNLSAWNAAHDEIFSYPLRQYCMTTRESRHRLQGHIGILQAYGDQTNAEILWQTHVRNAPAGEDGLLFCQGRDFGRQNPDLCTSFEHMNPSDVDDAVAFLVGQYDPCKETRQID